MNIVTATFVHVFTAFSVMVLLKQEYFHTVIAFLRLEKMDFGGIRGQHLSDLVVGMYNEFTELTNTFQSRGDDPLDTTNTVSQNLHCTAIL